jgi:DNA-directed RNA polymerase subunit RPC12/RpoP
MTTMMTTCIECGKTAELIELRAAWVEAWQQPHPEACRYCGSRMITFRLGAAEGMRSQIREQMDAARTGRAVFLKGNGKGKGKREGKRKGKGKANDWTDDENESDEGKKDDENESDEGKKDDESEKDEGKKGEGKKGPRKGADYFSY